MATADSTPSSAPDAVFIVGPPGTPAAGLTRALAALPSCTPLAEEPAPPVDLGREGDRRIAIGGHAGAGRIRSGGLVETRTALEGASRRLLQIPHLREVFRDPRFVLLRRPAREAMAAAYSGWLSGKLVSHPGLTPWRGPAWSFALVPGWRELEGADLGTIVVEQWLRAVAIGLADLAKLEPARLPACEHEALRVDPAGTVASLCAQLDLGTTGLTAAATLLEAELARPLLAAGPPAPELAAAIEARRAEIDELEQQLARVGVCAPAKRSG